MTKLDPGVTRLSGGYLLVRAPDESVFTLEPVIPLHGLTRATGTVSRRAPSGLTHEFEAKAYGCIDASMAGQLDGLLRSKRPCWLVGRLGTHPEPVLFHRTQLQSYYFVASLPPGEAETTLQFNTDGGGLLFGIEVEHLRLGLYAEVEHD